MNRLAIDFSPPTWRRLLHRTGASTWLVALLALGAAGVALSQWLVLRSERQAHASALAAARSAAGARATSARATGPVPALTEEQAAAINAAIMQLNLPWRALRDAVDEGTPETVALLALEPDARRHTLRITAEAGDADGMVGYVEQLKRQPMFTDVSIVRHEVVEGDGSRPIRFTLEALWRR